jgi:hypothetical protein
MLMTIPVMPAHALPITIDEATRGVGAYINFGSYATTSSLGLFSESVTDSTSTPTGPAFARASQTSDISLFGNVLTVIGAGMAQNDIPEPIYPLTDDNMPPSAGSGSGLSLQFTLDNWASYDAHSFLSARGEPDRTTAGVHLLNVNTHETIFWLIAEGSLNDSHSGLLGPGTYGYNWFASAINATPDSGGPLAFAFSSLTVSTVPEPSSLLLLGLVGLMAWQWKRQGRALS